MKKPKKERVIKIVALTAFFSALAVFVWYFYFILPLKIEIETGENIMEMWESNSVNNL